MTTADDDARGALVNSLMNGAQQDRDRFIITTLLDIKENGCAQRCATQPAVGPVEKWTPAATSTAISGVIIAIVEYFRK